MPTSFQTHTDMLPGVELFETFNDLWFWFIQAQAARVDGASLRADSGSTPRPCEPSDILKILDRLYWQRMLQRDHFLVLRHYGRRQYVPDPYRVKEARAATLWREAREKIEPVLIRKGIVKPRTRDILKTSLPNRFWAYGASLHGAEISKKMEQDHV